MLRQGLTPLLRRLPRPWLLSRAVRRWRCRWRARQARAGVRQRVRASGIDLDALLLLARQSFVQLQAAWDARDLHTLEACTTAPLMAELREQLQVLAGTPGESLPAVAGPGQRTEVVSLRAELLALDEIQEAFVASVEFSGEIRERCGCHAAPFRELWLLAQPKHDAPGWRIAGVQSLS